MLDGNAVTGFRTAATSALAVDVLAPARPLRVGVIGSGFEARHHVRALAATRDLTSVTVFSPNPASRARFTEHLAELAVPLTSAESAEEAVSGADLVVCAARSRDEQPTLRGAWLEPGMLVPLSDAVAGRVAGRRSADGVVLYKSVGAALQDLTVAAMCVRLAAERGVGTPLPVSISPVRK